MLDDPGLVDDLTEALKQLERRHVERVLAHAADKKEAARRLNVGLGSAVPQDRRAGDSE